MTKASDEDAVRRYLALIADPKSIVDEVTVRAAQAKVEVATDVIEKATALAELHKAQQPDITEIVERFVAVASRWSKATGVSREVLMEMGVPADVLNRAFRSTGTTVSELPRRNRPAPSTNAAAAAFSDGPLSVSDLAAKLETSLQTARKLVATLMVQGQIAEVGLNEKHIGRGKAATMYGRPPAKKAKPRAPRVSAAATTS